MIQLMAQQQRIANLEKQVRQLQEQNKNILEHLNEVAMLLAEQIKQNQNPSNFFSTTF